jgi:hypothetical protein
MEEQIRVHTIKICKEWVYEKDILGKDEFNERVLGLFTIKDIP